MTGPERLAVAVGFGRPLPAIVTDGIVVSGFNLDRHLAFGDVRVQDSNARKIQQLLDQL
jgi:hypothetical protein